MIFDMKNLNKIDAAKVRANALAMIYHAKSGHPGGSLSCSDLLAILFGKESYINRNHGEKTRFVLSKGHACPAMYSVAAEAEMIAYADLASFRKINGKLQGHPHVGRTPWVESSTGSLGQGFSAAIGMAMGYVYQEKKERIYVLMGDGELQEGEVWEGAMCASHYKLDNLCAIVDYNKMQSDDLNSNIMALEPLKDKWLAFNWHVIEIDGHDDDQIQSAFNEARSIKGRPTIIIAHTVKGKGVSFMEGVPAWHGSVTLRQEELEQALQDLKINESDIQAYINGNIWSKK